MDNSRRYRAHWLADVRLGGPDCQAAALRKAWQWEPLYNELLQAVLRKAPASVRAEPSSA